MRQSWRTGRERAYVRGMVATAKRDLTRLEALRQGEARLQVDRAFPGRIRGVSIITTGPALGHGFDVDRTTVEQVTEFAGGTRGRWTHGGLSEDGLGRHLGTWEDVRMESFRLCRGCDSQTSSEVCGRCGIETSLEWRSVGDFVFAASAHRIRPDGLDVPAPVYLMDRAQEDPEGLGISIVARFGYYEPAAREGEERVRRFARIGSSRDLKRGDWVADPAANPIGLHEGTRTPSALTESATCQLDRIVERDGAAKAKLRALAFLARYFGDTADLEPPAGADARESERVTELEKRVEEQAKELASLRTTLETYEVAEEVRQEDETAAYLEGICKESAELNAPIPAADVNRVKALLESGEIETARVLGEAFLARSRAEGQVSFSRTSSTSLAETHDRVKASVAARARMLRRRGWDVEINQEGTQIVRASPRGRQ